MEKLDKSEIPDIGLKNMNRASSPGRRPFANLMLASFGAVLVSACSSDPYAPSLFEAVGRRISDNLEKPSSEPTPLALGAAAGLPPAPGRRGGQPYIIGGTDDLVRGLPERTLEADLRFDSAEIADVANTILGDVLKLPYVLDTNLKGRVSLQIARGTSSRNLMDSLRQAVERAGGDITRSGNGYYISNRAVGRLDDQRIAQLRSANTSVTIIPLKFARASTVSELLRAVHPGVQITVDDPHNLLVISGPAPLRAQVASTAETLDADGISSSTVAVYPLAQSNANQVAEQLKKIYDPSGGQRAPVEFVALPRNNALLAIARDQASLSRVSQIMQGIDRVRSDGRRMYVVSLQHARAPVLANVLRESLGLPSTPASTVPATVNPLSGQPASMSVLPTASATPSPAPAVPVTPASAPVPSFSGQDPNGAAPFDLENVPLRVVANTDTNSLLVFATPGEYSIVQEAIRRLDIAPLQVLIEATILDVTLNDQLQFGVQAFLQNLTSSANTIQTGLTASSFGAMVPGSSGFNFVFSSGGQTQQAINALRSVTNVTVLSSPQVVTLDNQKATLEVGAQVPITTQTVTQTAVSTPAIVNSISYVQTGVLLNVTPRVNTNGGVDLDVRQEVTDAPTLDLNHPSLTPVLNRRVIGTRVSVQSSQTVALGGLVSETTSDGRNRVPVLGDIPVLGWLFGQTNRGRTRQELVVFLTPTVISSPDEARKFSQDVRRRLDKLRQEQGKQKY
jgi:general secretion pathway protein D